MLLETGGKTVTFVVRCTDAGDLYFAAIDVADPDTTVWQKVTSVGGAALPFVNGKTIALTGTAATGFLAMVIRKAEKALPKSVINLAEANITNSGKTVLGHFPGYIEKAKAEGASYFDIGDAWNTLTDAQRWAANTHFLDKIAASGDQVFLSLPKTKIRPESSLAKEIQYLINEKRYRWIDKWSLGKP